MLSATLRWTDRIQNFFSSFEVPNQQFRVELVDSLGNVIQPIYATVPGDPLLQVSPNQREFDLTAVLQPLAGQNVALRFTVEDDRFYLNVNLDDVSLLVETALTVTVDNVAPRITSLGDPAPVQDKGLEGEPVTLTLAFDDPGSLDVHTISVDWGDGTTDAVVLPLGSRSFSLPHTYSSGGIYPIRVALVDDDSGADAIETEAFISGAGIQEVDGERVLYVIGTSGDDQVTINRQGNGALRVHASFIDEPGGRLFTDPDLDRIVVLLCEGSDHLNLAGNLSLPAWVDAGGGDDHVNGGGGSDIILGGDGDDHLNGGGGDDLLIGGSGQDRLVGGPGDDLLFGGAFSPPIARGEFWAVLRDIQRIWSDADRELADRRAEIASRDDFFGQLSDDLAADTLTGASGNDWFLTFDGDQATDVPARKSGDVVTSLDS
ncbi:MAG: hypothetical protein J5I93_00710 [Pirellulaceae bacterium]|nr:hypothetical protein [Pirellulaceae bacterium]